MTIQHLNDTLNQLSQQRSREKVFEFANALVEWMGLKLNDGSKPQLLAPQTQKLKEYLVPAPQTVQPQLYRRTKYPYSFCSCEANKERLHKSVSR